MDFFQLDVLFFAHANSTYIFRFCPSGVCMNHNLEALDSDTARPICTTFLGLAVK